MSLVMMVQTEAACTPGSLDLDLVLGTGTGASSHPIAKCYNSLSVTVDVGCTLSVTANGQDNYIPSLFSAGDAAYTQVGSCPAGATTTATDSTVSANDVATLIATSIYSSGLTATGVATDASGIVTIISGDATLKFRASSASGSTGISTVGTVACGEATECAATFDGCAAGRFSILIDGTSKYVCGLCASGTYSASGGSCTACSGGYAAPAVGGISTDCAACSAGTFSTAGSSDCRPCEPGMYQDAGSQTSCKSCPTSWSSHTYGASGCVKCTAGRPTFSSSPSGATAGSAGYFTATMVAGTLGAGTMAAGFSYPQLLNACSPISALVSFSVDEFCAIEIRTLGSTTITTNRQACSDPTNAQSAAIAYYTSASVIMSRLANVDQGTIVKIVNKDTTTVTMSAIGASKTPATLTSVTGDLTVDGGDLVGTTVTTTCPVGTYKTSSGTTLSCPACDPGYYCPASATAALECAPGSYSTMGAGTCTGGSDCGDGKQFNPETNACDCAPGFYASAVGVCTICAVNTISPGGSTDATFTCTACSGATPYAAQGSDTCSVCPAGEAKNGSGVCTRCAAGEQPKSGGLTGCEACASSYYNPSSGGFAQFDACQKCAGGYSSTATTCVKCAVGTSGNGITCTNCGLGEFAAEGSKKCSSCPGGSEQNTSTKTGCSKCAAGSSREPFSSGACATCEAGSISKAGADVCSLCLAGTKQVGNECSPCPANTFSSDSGATTCTACVSGTNSEAGSTECSGCSTGSYFNSTSSACVECSVGFFQDREGEKTCKKCPIGKFSDETGADSCDSCPAGKYNSVSGSSTCRVCPGGTFSAAGKGSCTICAKGKFSAPGAAACSSCTAGYYANKLGSRACTACPVGSKCPGVAVTSPTLCAAGSFQSKPAQTTCTPCPVKTNAAKSGASKCTACSTATTPGTTTCSSRRRALLFTRLDSHTIN